MASVAADDGRRTELGEARVDRELPDCGLLAEAVEIGQELLLLDEQGVALGGEALQVVAGRGDTDRLGQREEGEDEGDDDRPEEER
jgi:hypothetical protein